MCPMSVAATGPDTAPPARPPRKPVPRYAVILWAIALITLCFGAWAVTRGDDVPPAYYVVKWAPSGKCSVVTEQPENGRGRLLWFTLLYESAAIITLTQQIFGGKSWTANATIFQMCKLPRL